jgi:hypothetical protein
MARSGQQDLNMFEKAEDYIKGIKRKLRKLICGILVGVPEMLVLLLSVSKFAPNDYVLVGQTIHFFADYQTFAALFDTILG